MVSLAQLPSCYLGTVLQPLAICLLFQAHLQLPGTLHFMLLQQEILAFPAITQPVTLLYWVRTSAASDCAHLYLLGKGSQELAMASCSRLNDRSQVIFFSSPKVQGSCSKQGTLAFLCGPKFVSETFFISLTKEKGNSTILCCYSLLNFINASTERIKVA